MQLEDPISCVKYVGPQLARLFSKKGIRTVEDALYFLPRAYEDRRKITPIGEFVTGQTATAYVESLGGRTIRKGRISRFEATVKDATGVLRLFWFRGYKSLEEDFAKGNRLLVHGEAAFFGGFARMNHPDYEAAVESNGKPVPSYHFGRVIPVYSETEGLHQKTLRRIMAQVLKESLPLLDEPLPEEMRTRLGLPPLRESFISLHFPKDYSEGTPQAPFNRIAFEEFFVLQLGLALKKQLRDKEVGRSFVDKKNLFSAYLKGLPFALTGDQVKALDAIVRDMGSLQSMSRLVQGDVGSGKTVVALGAAVVAASCGTQTAILVPTEVLAQQHHRTAEKLLAPLGIRSILFTQSTASSKEVRKAVESGDASVVIGTHALFQEKVKFHDLGLVVVDEQHRFGVEQRGELLRKAVKGTPHLLMMTATPIPRTLALTLYGDLDLTWIREKPANRLPIQTRIWNEKARPRLYSKIRETLTRGEQVYVIYPLVEDSEKLELKSATRMHESLSKEVFPEFPVALLHGRMEPEEKDAILADFKAGKYRLLVSTTVIEVGIDVPNATLMVVEHPDRLGLSQLHQLRGRVGRGDKASECILLVDDKIPHRLRILEETEDGFEIAEEDLKFRGPGEFLGTHQSGLPGFRAGHILQDGHLLGLARQEALALLEADPELEAPENRTIRRVVESRWKNKLERLQGGY
ncbi:ATP-dependent DNA helicase RecG [bacterium]|nr:ATP-dependent DNA helicase RecG [bacterium]